jgi:hypothetical protein
MIVRQVELHLLFVTYISDISIVGANNVEKGRMALCPFYTVYCPSHCLAASLGRFMPVQCEKEERETLAAILYGFTPFYIP